MNVIKITMAEAIKAKVKTRDTPILDYCRKLIKEGKDPNTRLEVYRNHPTPDVICRNIGEAAKLTVTESSSQDIRFAKYESFPANKTVRNR